MNIQEQVTGNGSATVPLFLHIPKTAGTTLSHCIYFECATDQEYWAEGGWLRDGIYYYPARLHKDPRPSVAPSIQRALRREDVRAVVGHFSFGIHQYLSRSSTYITLLRNPVERILSLYEHIRKYKDTDLHDQLVSEDISIEDFVLELGCKETDNDQTRRVAGVDPEFGGCTEATLNAAKENLERCFSVVGITERFDETLVLLRRVLNWHSALDYQSELVNPSRPKTTSLPQKTIDAILARNHLDMQLYEFAQQLLAARIAAEGAGFYAELDRLGMQRAAPMEEPSVLPR